MPGPPPKSAATRRRRNKVAGARTLLPVPYEGDGIKRAPVPTLDRRQDGLAWHPEAVREWDAIFSSPMAGEYTYVDVFGLVRLMDLIHDYWSMPSDPRLIRTKLLLAQEIRLEEQNYGLTPLDRRRLQWEIIQTEGALESHRRQPRPATVSDPREEY